MKGINEFLPRRSAQSHYAQGPPDCLSGVFGNYKIFMRNETEESEKDRFLLPSVVILPQRNVVCLELSLAVS